ncbi:type I secretion target repeat protein [Janibacter sp. HTCC2649]|nr:type I secretion target repeat protein [Janibacter sp. HTCC2649]
MLALRRSALASTVTLAMLGTLGIAAAPSAQAAGPDAATTAVGALFTRLATDFLPQVASGTAVAKQLPTLAVTPAESVGLKTAFSSALGATGPLKDFGTQDTLADLKDYVDDADDSGWVFTSSNPSDTSLTVGFTRTLTQNAGLDIRDESGTLSLSSGTGIVVTGTLTGSFTFVFDSTSGKASLTAPSLSIATSADLPATTTINAGLGILGVSVTGTADTDDYRLQSNVSTSWSNPDNDAAGLLAFDNPDTAAPDDGELAAEGAGTGIVTATQTGSLAGSLDAKPRASDRVAGLPSVGTTVTLSSAAPASFEAPLVTAVVPEAAKPFLTMTPRDLAAALSQAASAVLGMQNAGDGDLPLMRGSLSNAIDAVGGIKTFLADQVPDADPDDATPGQPKFASLQDMLAALDAAEYTDGGWSIDVLDSDDGDGTEAATYDPGTKKVNFTVVTTRGGKTDLELNPLGAATSGTGTAYTATGLTASGVDLDGPKNDGAALLAGRKVTAGTSTGTVATIDSGTKLTLTADGWTGGTPTNGTLFAIEAADPKTGAPQFADVLKTRTGIAGANAEVSTAKITPDVVVTLPMVLDLRDPDTYTNAANEVVLDCDPGTGTAPCPFKQIDDSGLARIITSLPLPADRVLLRQSVRDLLVADAAITSPVQISTTSGFLALDITGDVELSVPTGHLQTLALTKTGDVPVPAFVEQVRQQTVRTGASTDDVFKRTLGGTVKATLDISVPDAPTAFGEDEENPDSTGVTLTATVAALADGIDTGDVTVAAEDADRADLLKALNIKDALDKELEPTSLFGGVRAALEGAGADLTTMTGGGLDTPIPFVGSSVSQLIGAGASGTAKYADRAGVDGGPAVTVLTDPGASFTKAFLGRQIVVGSTLATIVGADGTTLDLAPQLPSPPVDNTPYLVENELLGAVHVLSAMTPATLQETLAMAEASLGNGSTIDFGLAKNGAGEKQLRLDLSWARAYEVTQPVSLTLGDDLDVVGLSSGGELSVAASGTVKLRLYLPLTAAAMTSPIENTKVDKDWSEVSFAAKVTADNAFFGANLGPISLELGRDSDGDRGSVHAGFAVKASGATTKDDPSISDFFTDGFELAVGGGDACDEDDQVVCAAFPLWANGTKVTGNLKVTTTLGAQEDSLTDLFTGASTEITYPQEIKSILENGAFKFGSLLEGVQQYMFYSETALRTASNGGEMPVVGKDLQAGADFMGKVRGDLATFIEDNGDVSQVGPAKKLLTDELSKALGVVVGGSSGIEVNFTCKLTLLPPTAPAATPNNAVAADTTQYVYKVVSTYAQGTDPLKRSVPSAATVVVKNAATLTAGASGKFNTVTWTKAVGANGYQIIRATQTGTTDPPATAYRLVGTVGALATYDDHLGTPPTQAYAAATTNPLLPATTCPDDTPVQKVDGVSLGLTMGQGVVSGDKGCVDAADGKNDCIGAELPVDLGIPGLSLQTGDSGKIVGDVGWRLSLKVVMSRTEGFYVDTSTQNELAVGAALRLDAPINTTALTAQLSIIKVDVSKKHTRSEFVGSFGIDIKGKDGKLKLADIARTRIADAITVNLDAIVDIAWHLEGTADAALPGISTDFVLKWAWSASTSNDPKNPAGLLVQFNNVTLDAGKFFGKALKPYLQQVVDATKPLQPVLDTIFTPMPVISDLSTAAGGQPITIATLAETFSTIAGGPKIKPFLDAIKTTKDFLKNVNCPDATAGGCGVNIGSFTLSKTAVTTTRASAGNASQMIATKDPAPVDSTGKTPAQQVAAKDASGRMSNTAKRALAGLSFPVLDDPTRLFDLISGGDIPLVEFDSGPLTLGFQFQKSFGPIYAPPPVMMVIGGGASVSMRIAAGFDTYGIRRAIEGKGAAEILDSLYFKTVDQTGKPIPVVQFTGYLEAGASVSLAIIEVGVVGGVRLTVGFYWNDPNNDGKFRLFEFGKAVAINPICLFNVSGELSLYIKVFVTLGFSPFSVSFDFTLINIKLLDFSLKPDCEPAPPRLAGRTGSTLYVFAGKFGTDAQRGAPWGATDKAETWVIRQVPTYKDEEGVQQPAVVEVRGLGITETFPDTGDTAISTVVVDARDTSTPLTVSFTGGQPPVEGLKAEPFTKTAVVFGSDGDDVIRTGVGTSWVDGGKGADTITTLDRTDLATAPGSAVAHVAGGQGPDAITVGNGNDVVAGDASLAHADSSPSVALSPDKAGSVTLTNAVKVDSTLTDAADADFYSANPTGSGIDQIAAGLGQVRLSGNGGADTIGTANDSVLADSKGIKAGTTGGSAEKEALYRAQGSVIVGGAGSDVLKSGSATDTVYTGTFAAIGESDAGSGDADTDTNTVSTGTGSDTVYGSNGFDFVTTASTATQTATVFGGGAADVLTGGLGSDKIYGGPGDDYVVAAPATVSAPGAITDVLGSARDVAVLPDAGGSTKLLVGGTGSDRIYGSDGPSTIFGDTTVDACDVQSNPVSAQPAETTVSADAADLILGGNGVDVVNAGGGNDWAYAAGASDRLCGNSGADHLYAGDAADLVFGGSGDDQAYGEDGPDQVYGNDGADSLYGSTGADRLQGNAGSDWVDGGSEADVLLGGTSVAGAADGGDVLLGAGGADVLVGDNAPSDVLSDQPYPTDLGSTDATLGGADYLVAGDDDDRAYGGLADDTVYGGLGNDVAEGNPGSDGIWGEAGDDDIIGGSSQLASGTEQGRPDSGDTLTGGDGQDVITGDNATVTRGGTAHAVMAGRGLTTPRGVDLADEGSGSPTGVSGNDLIDAGSGVDVVFAQRGNDTVTLGDGADYGEGGPDTDSVTGGAQDDDVVGGSFTTASGEAGQADAGDTLTGGDGQDVITGDNAKVTRGGPAHPVMSGRGLTTTRGVDLADEGAGSPTGVSGNDVIDAGNDADVVFAQRGNDTVTLGDGADYGEGGPDADSISGGAQDDDVVGGSYTPGSEVSPLVIGQPDGGDTLAGDAGQDVVLGDNGSLTRPAGTPPVSPATLLTFNRVTTQRTVLPYDLGDSPVAGTSGADTITGDADNDVLLGQGGADRADAGAGADYAEGGQGADLVLGGTEDDDVVGGSSAGSATTSTGQVGQPDGADNVYGGPGSDLIMGDNSLLNRPTTERDWRTLRANATQTALVPSRGVTFHDLVGPAPAAANATHSAGDALSGQDGVDVIFGQDGDDRISGGGDDDYVEADGGADTIHGDVALAATEIVAAPAGAAWSTPAVDAAPVTAGQDDLTGGWGRQGYRDGNDVIHGDGNDDFVVGDNGSIQRVVDGGTTDRVYTPRYGTSRLGQAKVRVAGGGASSTRFCPTTGSTTTSTCEVAGAFGSDTVFGDDGQDVLYGQDGGDNILGGADDDDIYGELGADTLFGEDGEDAILGDRGGIQNRFETGSRSTTTTLTMPPAVSFTTRRDGSVSREADLLHDVNGTDFVGGATSTPMPLNGITFGGADRIRGGAGHDSIHAGAGDDLANGDSGGDSLFGDRGKDVMWGGAGKVCTYTDALCLADAGTNGEFIDHIAGGKDEDVIDWRPRGAYGTGAALTGRTCSTSTDPVTTKKDGTTDPCSWFEMTDRADDVVTTTSTLANNQHHQGVDWVYGGWDRDVMQGDLSNNGPHNGDRLIDWSGVYNLWSHCNAAYGGFTDVRVPAPAVEDFLKAWATGNGAGRPGGGGASADVLTPGTSAYDELALVYNPDGKDHGTGSAYPTTPGHFDDANACAGY